MYIDVDEIHKNLIRIEVDDEVITPNEIENIDAWVKKLHKEYDIINVIVLVSNHSRMGIKAIYETLKFAINEHKIINKIALIGNTKWLKFGAKLDNFIFPWQEKYFSIEQLEDAWHWVTHK